MPLVSETTTASTIGQRPGQGVWLAGVALLAVALAGVLAVLQFVAGERSRDLTQWQIRLGIVADGRAAAVAGWWQQQFHTLAEIAENASVQLYMSELALAGGDRAKVTAETAQADYLRNLLQAVAERSGFAEPTPPHALPANVQRLSGAGLALSDIDGGLLAATPGMPPIEGLLKQLVQRTARGERGFVDLHAGSDGRPSLVFLQPVFALQGGRKETDVVGLVLGLRPVGADLFGRLAQPGETERSAETLLIRAAPGGVEYVSPLKDGTPPLTRTLARDTPDLDAAAALRQPGRFGVGRDYAGAEVLAVSRRLSGPPWLLLRKVDRAEALAESDRRLAVLLTVLLLAIALVAAALVAVWRHASSRRANAAADALGRSNARLEALSRFLRLVSDGQPTRIAAVDDQGRFTFANRQAAFAAGASAEAMLGKSLAPVPGPAAARPYEEMNRRALTSGAAQSEIRTIDDADGQRRVLRAEHLPLPAEGSRRGVLMIEEDITRLVEERERRERALGELIATLVAVVDRRDPYSADHSNRVAEVADAIAREMQVAELDRTTAVIAGRLMNLGKISVPSEVLTKNEPLTEAERRLVRESVQASADLLGNVAFDGPVVETLRQLQEQWDGGGPRGLAGEAILLPARILAVANAFVGMVSPRAYRRALSFDQAAQQLLSEAGTRLDRRPVSALLHFLENLGGRGRWAGFAAAPQAAQ
ncbi:MAG: PAS domain S-box protein [Alphaproteobacteria bacterium]|nr:PAS domain S-box protein [Alphaproteobacteria bacterium]